MIAKYRIFGSDGHEYDIESPKQIKRWIAEGRLERKTPVFVEGGRDWTYLGALPEFAAEFDKQTTPQAGAKSGGGLNALIPYKNVRALMAYYFAVFSVIPILGILLGLLAFVLGILGLRFRRKNPAAGGAVHAWIGILAGGFFGFGWLALTIWFFAVVVHEHH